MGIVTTNPFHGDSCGVARGVSCIRGLRIPVARIMGRLAAGRSHDEILAGFPDLEAADITATFEYAAAAVQERGLPLTRPARRSSSTPTSYLGSQSFSEPPTTTPSPVLKSDCIPRATTSSSITPSNTSKWSSPTTPTSAPRCGLSVMGGVTCFRRASASGRGGGVLGLGLAVSGLTSRHACIGGWGYAVQRVGVGPGAGAYRPRCDGVEPRSYAGGAASGGVSVGLRSDRPGRDA